MFIHWIVIYPVDSAIQRLNNRGQERIQAVFDNSHTNSLKDLRNGDFDITVMTSC